MDVNEFLDEPGPVGLFTRLARVGLLVDAFQHECLDRFDLRFIDFSVLRVLELAGPPYRRSPTELADIVLRSSGGMTQILDRLEAAGFVERTPDPGDRRKVVVGLTRRGRRMVERAGKSYAGARARVLGSLTPAEVGEIDVAVRRLLTVLTEVDVVEEAS